MGPHESGITLTARDYTGAGCQYAAGVAGQHVVDFVFVFSGQFCEVAGCQRSLRGGDEAHQIPPGGIAFNEFEELVKFAFGGPLNPEGVRRCEKRRFRQHGEWVIGCTVGEDVGAVAAGQDDVERRVGVFGQLGNDAGEVSIFAGEAPVFVEAIDDERELSAALECVLGGEVKQCAI